jgi:hypothetical protein
VLLASSEALATPPPPATPDVLTLRVRRRNARIERGFGWGLSALGFAACTVGIVFLGVAGQQAYDQGSAFQLTGGVTLASGAVLVVPGIALSVVGQNALTDAEWRIRLLAGSFIVPSSRGVVAGVGFRF